VLDLPEPWRVADSAGRALVAGGIFLCYLPTVPQVVKATEALQATGMFGLIETIEILLRPWNIDSPSVRPAHRMVAHTGFLTTARRVQAALPAAPDES
jgi:tRNA (adenine57-N1/adenine58-N1)-methyltransferase